MNPEGQSDPVTPGERTGDAGRSAQPSRRIGLTSAARILLLIAPWAFIAYLFRDLDAVGDAFEDASLAPMVGGLFLTLPALLGAALLWTRLVGHLSRGRGVAGDVPPPARPSPEAGWPATCPGKVWSYGARVVHTDADSDPEAHRGHQPGGRVRADRSGRAVGAGARPVGLVRGGAGRGHPTAHSGHLRPSWSPCPGWTELVALAAAVPGPSRCPSGGGAPPRRCSRSPTTPAWV